MVAAAFYVIRVLSLSAGGVLGLIQALFMHVELHQNE